MSQINTGPNSMRQIAVMFTPYHSTTPQAATCPSCKTTMTLVRVMPRFAGMAELHTFECKECRTVTTQAAENRPR